MLASPPYNFGVDQHTKTWIDLLIADPRLGPGTTALNGRAAPIITAQGGGYTAGAPREGWDHNTPYLQRIFAEGFGMDVSVITDDLTLAEVDPAMASMVGAGRESLSQAHEQAAGHASRLAVGAPVA